MNLAETVNEQERNELVTDDERRLWIVTELYYPEETSTGYYMTKIGEGLAGLFNVNVLCGQPNYSRRGLKAPKEEFHNGVSIRRAAGTTLDKNVIPFRLINMVTLGSSMFFKALAGFHRGDRILVVTTPPLLPFIAAVAALSKGAAFTLLIHDNYPEILVAAGKARENSLLTRVLDLANRWLYKYASRIIVVGRDMRELVGRKTEGLDVPVITIPNWAELETVRPLPREGNSLLKELGLKDKFVFLYAGNMGYPNDLESIVEAARELQRSDPKAHFVFLGAGVKRRWLEQETANLKLKNVTILDSRPRSEQTIFLNACDVGIVSLVGRMKGVSMPSRTYNILAAGKPMLSIAEPGSEIAMVTEEDDVGFVVRPGDPSGMIGAVRRFLSLEAEEMAAMGQRARSAAIEKYSLETAIEAYAETLSAGEITSRT